MKTKCVKMFKSMMQKSVKSLLSITLSIFFLMGSITTVKAAPQDVPVPEGYSKVAQTSKIALYYNDKDYTFVVQDLSNGFIWDSSVRNEVYDISKLNDQWKGNVKSLFNFSYTNVVTSDGTLITGSAASQKPAVTAKTSSSGLSITYDFSAIKIKLAVDIKLEDGAINVSVPIESIKEEGNFGLVSLEMLPFFGAAKDNQNGYIFYPDGSGALMDFTDPVHYGAKKRSWNIYGSDVSEFMAEVRNRPASIPVFGIKQGDNAMVAIVTEGDYDTTINLTPTGNVVDLNRISPEFIYRRFYVDPRTKKKVVKRYDKKISQNNHSVKYILLNGDKANYSGMANAYRDYLLNGQKIAKKINANDKIPLGLDLFMGINEKRLIFNKFIPMTTFDQAKSILEKFKGSGVDNIQTNLLGWTQKGMNTEPLYFPANRKLGGDSGLKNLETYAKDSNIKMFLHTDFTYAYPENGGFSKRNDVVYQASGLIATNPKETFFIFNPFAAKEKFLNSFLPSAKKNNVIGVDFSWLGDMIYYDYNKKHPSTKEETANTWNEIMDKAAKELGSVSVITGNAYSLKYVDRIFEVPDEDNNYFITTESVPFYQMVVHGLIPYSSELDRAGNLTADLAEQKLKWVEYGYMPYFQLTHESPKLLKYTNYNELFTSKYDEWIDTASGVYKEFNERLSGVWSQYMTNHEKVADNIYKVTYANGTQVYVNYNDRSVGVNGFTVKAKDYLVVEKGGKVK